VGVEQHLVGLQGIGPQEEGPAVRQLDMGDLELYACPANNRKILAPVELERLAWCEHQRHEGAAPCRLFLALPICFPNRRENDPPDRFLARLIRAKAATRL